MLRMLSLFLGPVFAKEMIEMARRKRYYVNRVFYGLVLLFCLFIVWENYAWRIQTGNTPTIKALAMMAKAQFEAIGGVQYFAAYILVPLFLCGVIASEREERTLELLFTTLLSNREIVLGKLISRVVVLILLILTALPILSMIMFFGGVDPDSLWRMVAVTLLATLFSGAHSIYFSVVTKSPIGALVRTYWWTALWLLGLPMTVMLIMSAFYMNRAGPPGPEYYYAIGAVFAVDPLGPFIAALDTFTYNQIRSVFGSNWIGEWYFPLCFVVPSSWSVFLIWRAIARLRLPPTAMALLLSRLSPLRLIKRWQAARAEARSKLEAEPSSGLWSAGKKMIAALWQRLCGSGRASRVWFGIIEVTNPLWLRARRARVYDRDGPIGKIQWAAWLVALFFFFLIWSVDPHTVRGHEFGMGFSVPIWIAVAGLAAIMAATSLVGDRRRGFLDLLLMTPLKPSEIIDGTFLAVWQHMRRIYWLPVVMGLIFCMTSSTTLLGLGLSLITATLFCSLLMLHGITCSLTAHTFPAALVPTFIFPLVMLVGVVFLMEPFRDSSGRILWVSTGIALPVAWFWVRRRITPASLGAFLLVMHIAIASLATGWTAKYGQHGQYPIAGMHPGYLTVIVLEGHTSSWSSDGVDKMTLLPYYWAALVVNFLLLRLWVLANFERITGRTRPGVVRASPADAQESALLATRDETVVQSA